jgi:O-antigen/teichoic acid export membrane protein
MNSIKTHLGNSLFLNTYLLVIMRVFGAGTGFIFWALAARMVATDEMGIATGAVSAATLIAGLAQLGLGYGIVRHLGTTEDGTGLLNLSIVVSGLAGAAMAGLFLIALPFWSPALLPLRADLLNALIFLALALSTTTTQLLHWAFLALRRLSFSVWKLSIQSVLAIILLIALQPMMPGHLAIVAAYTLSTILGLAIAFWGFLPAAHPGYHFSLRFKWAGTAFARYSFVNYLADQFNRSPDALLPLIVISQLGAGAGAIFFVVWTFGRSVGAWAGSIAESLFAEGAGNSARASSQIWRAVRLGLLLSAGLAAAVILSGRLILSVYGPAYVEQGAALLAAVALSGVPTVLLAIFVNYLRTQDRLRAVSAIMACSVGLGMLLCIAMLRVSLAAAGVGWMLGQVLVLAGAGIWWRWLGGVRRRVDWEEPGEVAAVDAAPITPGVHESVGYSQVVTERVP